MISTDPLYSRSPPRPVSEDRVNVLIVEDDAFAMEFLIKQVVSLGYVIYTAENGEIALNILREEKGKIDVVMMDHAMPVMDGLTAARHIKADPALKNIPVIMVTATDSPEAIKNGIESGAFYYLTKPVQRSVLHSVLNSAARKAHQSKILERELRQHRRSFGLIDSCKFQFQKLEDAEGLAVFISNFFPVPDRVLPGLGELFINAVEHGNLGIGYDRKAELVKGGTWRSEIERLQNLPENAGKFATATLARKDNGIYAVVEDQGSGFDWKKFILVNPASAGLYHGRGIALARAVSFDGLSYNEKGNQAIGFVGYGAKPEW